MADNLLKIRSHNEIAELSANLAEMAEELTAYMVRNKQAAVREEHDRTELVLAGRIQASVLPTVFSSVSGQRGF